MKISRGLVLGLLGGLVACQKVAPPGEQVQVTRVLGGQAVEVRRPDQSLRRLRLAGVQTPDRRQQPWGDRAFRGLNDLVKGEPTARFSVVWTAPPPGPRGAYQGYLWRGDLFLNETMLKTGLGYYVPGSGPDRDRHYEERLYQAQNQGRILGLGIWDPQAPMRALPPLAPSKSSPP